MADLLRPNGNSATHTGWSIMFLGSGAKWEQIDETSQDGSTTYIYTTTADDTYGATLTNSTETGDVDTLEVQVYAARLPSGGTITLGLRIDGTDYFGSSKTLTTSYAYYTQSITPPTGMTETEVDSMEVLVKFGSSGKGYQANVTWAAVNVTYTGGSTTGTTRLGNLLVPEKYTSKRLANTIVGDKEEAERLGNILLGDKFLSKRLGNTLIPNKFKSTRLAHKVNFELPTDPDSVICRPSANSTHDSRANWTGSWSSVDEDPYSDADYMSRTAFDAFAGEEICFETNNPSTNIGDTRVIKIYLRARATGGGGESVTIKPCTFLNATGSKTSGTDTATVNTSSFANYTLEMDMPLSGTVDADTLDVGIEVVSENLGFGDTFQISHFYWDYFEAKVTTRLANLISGDKFTHTRLSNTLVFPAHPETDPWWDSNYARRAPITFGTNHDALEQGHTVTLLDFVSGYEKKIATNGTINESIQHSGRQMAYSEAQGERYIAWLAQNANTATYKIYITKIDDATLTVATPVEVADVGSAFDTHLYPAILLDSSGYIHLFYDGHNSPLKYRKSTNPNDISTWGTEATIGTANTYPRPIEDASGNLYVFVRGTNYERYSYFKSTDGGSTWSAAQQIADYVNNYGGGGAIYCGGAIYKNGRMHIVLTFWDWYGGDNKGRSIVYMYSDDFTDWYAADGTQVATTGTDPLLYTDSAAVVTKSDNADATFGSGGTYYHTNTEGLAVDDSDHPYFTYQDWTTAIREECNLWFATHNGTSWSTTNLSGLSGAKKMFYYRAGGQIYWDNTNVYIYTFVQPGTGEKYGAGELYRYKGALNGTAWSYDYMTKNTGYGIGMITTLDKVYNGQSREIAYCRGADIFWLEDDNFPLIKNDGDDVRIIRQRYIPGSDSYNSYEVDRVPDRWNAEDTSISWSTNLTVPANADHMHEYERFWIYYNYYNASNPSRDPDNVFNFYDGFEEYTAGSDINGQGGWTAPAGKFTIFNYESGHPNKLYSGINSLFLSTASTTNKAYISQTLDQHVIEGWIWITDMAVSSSIALYIQDSGTSKEFRIGILDDGSDNCDYFISGDAWYDSGIAAPISQYHHYKIKIDSNGISAWVDGASVVTNNTHMTTADRFGVAVGGAASGFLDSIQVTKYVGNEPEMTLGTVEGTTDTGTIRLANIADPAYIREIRVANKLELQKELTKRIAQLVDTEKEDAIRVANLLTGEITQTIRVAQIAQGDKELSTRVANWLQVDKEEADRVANAVLTDKELTTRVANILVPEKYDIERLANELSLEKNEIQRIMNTLVLDKEITARLANSLNLSFERFIRVAHTLVAEKEVAVRLANTLVITPTATTRVANLLSLDKHQSERLAHLVNVEQQTTARIAHKVSGEKNTLLRIANLVDLSQEAQIRLANLISPDKESAVRIAQLVSGDKETVTRVANLVNVLQTIELRIANAVLGEKETIVRIANQLNLEDTATTRLANLLTFEQEAIVRLANILNLELETTTRIMNELRLEDNKTVRLANIILFGIATGIRTAYWSLSTLGLKHEQLDTMKATNQKVDSMRISNENLSTQRLTNDSLKTMKIKNQELDP